MPELPEVETIRKQIEKELLGEVLGDVEVRKEKVFVGDKSRLKSKKLVGVSRQGKYLFLILESGEGLQVHLKMTGRLIVGDHAGEIDYGEAKHTRVVIETESGRNIYYWDTRMFGYLRMENDIRVAEEKVKKTLGPDPWEMTGKELIGKLKKTIRTIKDVLLDQKIIAGVGNIYANDGLWLSGVDPRRRANTITKAEALKILKSLRQVMERSLAIGGASDNTFRDLYGARGKYQDEFLVYGKHKGVCQKCGRDLLYVKVGGRGTWICERDQK